MSCPPYLESMGKTTDDPLESSLGGFVAAERAREDDAGAGAGADRDSRALAGARAKAAGIERMVPVQFANRTDAWGGGLRRMSSGCVGPRREDEHYFAPRHVPVGFARYVNPTVDPADYMFYLMSGWRVAVPRATSDVDVRALLQRIYKYGPGSAGFARLGDTLVPAILGPGDRQTLAGTAAQGGPASRKFPLA